MSSASAIVATNSVLALDSLMDGVPMNGAEVPRGAVGGMPERRIVTAASGTPATSPGTSDYMPVSVARVDVRCYGATPYEASRLADDVKFVLKRWKRGTAGDHFVYWFKHTGGPRDLRDPDGEWPVSIVTFTLQLADERV